MLPINQFNYLNQSNCIEIEGVDDCNDFEQLKGAFECLGMEDEYQQVIYKIVASVLHIGNIQFTNNNDNITIHNTNTIKIVSELLEIDNAMLEKVLLQRKMEIKGQITIIPLKYEQSIDARDALAKTLYYKLFQWIVNFISLKLSSSLSTSTIGILDIFGFVSFLIIH